MEHCSPVVRTAGVAAAAAVVLLPVSVGAEPVAEFSSGPSGEHCVVRVEGQHRSGELLLSSEVCFGTLAEALASAGVDVDPGDSTVSMRTVSQEDLLAASSVLGVHYDGFNWTGASITVSGTTCGGGYTNLSSAWINRVSSTFNGCPTVRFFDGYDKTGSSEVAVGNLGALNNRTNSIQYDQ